jgi:hypothetical protein
MMKYMLEEQKKQSERITSLEKVPSEDFKHYKRLIVGCIFTG